MKAKHIVCMISAIVALAAVVAGVAVFVTKFLAEEDEENYIECEVGPEEE